MINPRIISLLILIIILGVIGCKVNDIPLKENGTSAAMHQFEGSKTAEMTRTSTKTTVITITPRNTISEDEKMDLISNLVETNGGCKLPCLWGITPGKTKGIEAISFLDDFAMLSSKDDNSMDTFGDIIYLYKFSYLGKEHTLSIGIDKNGIVSYIFIENFRTISNTLEELGIPQEAWFRSDFPLYFAVPIELDLYYPQKGLIVGFDDSGTQYYDNDVIKICRSNFDKTGTYLLLGDPARFSTYYSIYLKILGYLPDTRIVDGSFGDWTSASLVEGLRNEETDACFTSEGEFWRK